MEFSMFMKLSAVCETKFHYQDKIRPSDYVVDIASNMQVLHISLHKLLNNFAGEFLDENHIINCTLLFYSSIL